MAFDNKVQYHGDGGQGPNQLDSGSLDDYHALMKQGKIFGSDLSLRELSDSLRLANASSVVGEGVLIGHHDTSNYRVYMPHTHTIVTYLER